MTLSFLLGSDSSTLQSPPCLQDLLRERAEATDELKARLSTDQLSRYAPYLKQLAFHTAGLEHRERLLMAANQSGKTFAGAMEMAIHLTGRYPDWWPGRRWDRPIRAWAGSQTADVTRDGAQRLLVG